jgi:tetratricopeptide (TPR) repeat protein
MQEGRLLFRSADGQIQRIWVDEVVLMVVDRGGIFDDFNQAERFFAQDEHEQAILRYRRAYRLSEEFWVDLIAVRLLIACDAAGQLDTAVLNFMRVLNGQFSGPPAAARLIPRSIPEKRDARTQRALEQLGTALTGETDEAQRALLSVLRYEILRQSGDRRVTPAAARIAALSIPPSVRSRRAYEIQLHAVRKVLEDDVQPVELDRLDQTVRDCPEEMLPDFLVLKGWTLLRAAQTREEVIRASWPFLRVAIHFPDDSRATEGLYGAALALERIGRADKAIDLLEECLAHERLTDQTRSLAQELLARLRLAEVP